MSSHTQQTKQTRTAPRQADAQRHDVCPTCGHSVPAEITRHKTLGIYVPVWGPGTCRNPDCGTDAAGPRH
ncbi:hypothetical protein ABTZ21_08945 [Streptomyces sp. NPDC096191]|uniref:hypothetical protein n=1 Tax=Streptomyces sp. NPDC096191 TaxID=3155426 RepID=UPI0033284342